MTPAVEKADADRLDSTTLGREDLLSAAIAVAAGVLATIGGPSPTGHSLLDIGWVALAVSTVTWVGARAPVPVAAGAVLLAGALSASWPLLLIGCAAFLAAMVFHGASSGSMTVRTVSGPSVASASLSGLAVNLAVRSDLGYFFGASAVVGAVVVASLFAAGLAGRGRPGRVAVGAVAFALLFVAAGLVGFGSAAQSAIDDIRLGDRLAQQGLDQLDDGALPGAARSLASASDAFGRAHAKVVSPWGLPSALVPVAAQHRSALVTLSGEASATLAELSVQLDRIDLDDLTVRDGRIDLDAIFALEDPLGAVEAELAALADTVDGIRNPWLVTPFAERLDELAVQLDEQLDRSTGARELATAGPALLGGEGERVYFVAFTTPSEARGLGGFMGNWAEVTAFDGALAVTDFGRSDDLDEAAPGGERRLSGPDDWLSRYGRFGFDSWPGGTVGEDPWKNITMSPDMRATGEVIAELYPQSGGRQIDGVFVLDVYAVAELLTLTGPVRVPGSDLELDSENAPRFLLSEQYDVTVTRERVDMLERVSEVVIEELLQGPLPPTATLIDTFGPLVEFGRLTGFATDPDEQAVIERLGLAGTLVAAPPRDGVAVTFNNAIGNKIDFHLRGSSSYEVEIDAGSNSADAVFELVLENRAPRAGRPEYVIGNPSGRPDGTNRTFISLYSRLPVLDTRRDGTHVVTDSGTEAGYFVTSMFVELGPGESTVLTMSLGGPIDLTEGYSLDVRTPPAATPVPLDVAIFSRAGTDAEPVTRTVFRPGHTSISVD